MPHRLPRPTVDHGLWTVDSQQGLVPLLVILVLVVTWGAGNELSRGTPHPLSQDIEYLISLQRTDGSICMTSTRDQIVPYFSNLTAQVMLDYPNSSPE